MATKRNIGEVVFDSLNVLFVGFLGIIMVYPMVYELFVSLSDPATLTKHRGIMLMPNGFTLSSYRLVFNNPLIISGYMNTIFILIVGTAISLLLTCFAAYFLTRRKAMWYKPVMVFMLVKMYFSGGLIPFYLTVRNVGLYDSVWALILPVAVSTYNVILLRSYFSSLPESLVESVFIDGGGHFTTLFRVMIPLSMSAMAVMVLYYGVGYWNSWFNAKIFLQSEGKFPLQLVLHKILIMGEQLDIKSEYVDVYNYEYIYEGMKAAAVIVATLPILVLYPFLQKYFVTGLMIGSLKE